MHYETLLFTRNQRQDFTVFIRPSLLSNKDVSTIGAVFNYITDVSRLKPDFPSLYAFPLNEYLLLLRHYDSGRKHAGRAIGVIEGIAVPKAEADGFTAALAHFVTHQADLLNVSAAIPDLEEAETEASPRHDWDGRPLDKLDDSFVGEFLARRQKDRLFLPFTTEGRDLLIKALSDPLFTSPPFFAFGTNSDVLAQLGKQADIDIVSFFKTERPSYRSRRTNGVSGSVAGFEPPEAPPPDPSMSVRPVAKDETRVRPQAAVETTRMRQVDGEEADEEADKETMVGENAMPIHEFTARHPKQGEGYEEDDADDAEATMLTMRQMRDQIREEEKRRTAAAKTAQPQPAPKPRDPISRIFRLISSIFSPNNSKPK
jgi:hypothetical protein